MWRSRETFGLATDENGDMTPDEDSEAVENREAAEIARSQKSKSGNFQEDADSERKASQETFGRTQTRKGKPLRKHSGGRPMRDER